ncbi:MAG: hypothetical protein CVV02_12590 [Firmicutes bacterium HGW-Firmicutes-7]|nr:MAG: hypothetical protein CVV02_12590 [Firmicutes bacterium HGW-Firmicutes-7]
MQAYSTLSELITARKIEENKGITFISSDMDDCFISYNSLFNISLRYLYNMQKAGFKQGDEVIFQIEDNQRFVSSFWACILGGMIPVPITTGLNDEHKMKLFKIWDILRAPKIISTKKFTASINDYAEINHLLNQINEINSRVINVEDIEKLEGYGEIAEVKNEDIAFIQFSSGSTGDPKGVMLTNKNVLTNINDIANSTKTTKQDNSLSWMPLTHDMGLIAAHLVSTFVGVNQYLMPPPLFIKNPTLWLGKAHEYKATQLYSPNFGYKHFLTYYSPDAAKDWNLSNVRMIFNGAEPISIELCTKFHDEMVKFNLKRNCMVTCYGLAEASVGVSCSPVGEEAITITVDRRCLNIGQQIQIMGGNDTKNKLTFVDVGYPLDHCDIRISDENNEVLRDGFIGRILIKGGNVTSGYYNNKEATNKVISKDGWLNTGDLGFVLNGRLVITGRAKDIIFIHGQNVYSHDLERVAEEHEGIEFGKVVACGTFSEKDQADEIIMFVVYKKKIENFIPLYRSLKSHILLNTGIEVKHIIPVKKIPKTTSGKVRRYLLRDTYANDGYEHILVEIKRFLEAEDLKKTSCVPLNEMEAKLIEIWKEVLGIEKVGINDSFFGLGGDSLKMAALVYQIHKAFHVEMSLSELFIHSTIKELERYIGEAKKEKYSSIEPVEEEEYYPVSCAQNRMYILNALVTESTYYNLSVAIMIYGNLDVVRVEKSFKKLMQRHEALRTSFELIDNKPMQKLNKDLNFSLNQIEIKEENIEEFIKEFIRPFKLSSAPLYRVTLAKIADEKHLLLIDMHHIISDGTSINILLKEFFEIYNGQELPELRIQYKDFSKWQNNIYETETIKKQEKYWLESFKNEVPVLNFPTDYTRPAVMSFEGSWHIFEIDNSLTKKLKNLSKQKGTTMFGTLFAAFNVLLARFAGQEDIVVGIPVAGRRHSDLENIIGMFINTVPLRSYPKMEKTFSQFLDEVKVSSLEAFENQDYQFDMILDNLNVKREQGRNPLFDCLFNYLNLDGAINQDKICVGELMYSLYEFEDHTAKFDLIFYLREVEERIKIRCNYRSNLFKASTIKFITEQYIKLLEEIELDDHKPLKDYDVFNRKDLKIVENTISTSNRTKGIQWESINIESEKSKTVVELFEQQAAKFHDNIAVKSDIESLTYGKLNIQANRIANVMLSVGSKKAFNTERVAILFEHGADMMKGILAVLKAGKVYVALDPEYPHKRLNYIMEDSGSCILLTNNFNLALATVLKHESNIQIHIVNIDELGTNLSEENPCCEIKLGQAAYIMYTSGSTGNPKGVVQSHQNIVNLIGGFSKQMNINPTDRIALVTSYSHTVSVIDIFSGLLCGAAIYPYNIKSEGSMEKLPKWLLKEGLTVFHSVPTIFRYLIEATPEDMEFNQITLIILGGETVYKKDVELYNKHFPKDSIFVNLFGSSEMLVGTSYLLDQETVITRDTVPLGYAMDGVKIYLLNEKEEVGVYGVGEIVYKSEYLAVGYWNMKEKTDELFVKDFVTGEGRIFRSGDLGRLLPDGSIEYIGRKDFQLKINGSRVEPDEIEAVISEIDSIRSCVVNLVQKENKQNFLVAYYVLKDKLALDVEDIKKMLRYKLPDYMVPTYFIPLKELPRTPNGKLDRKALLDIDCIDTVVEYVGPTNEIQEKLIEIWKDVLKVDKVGINNDFFDLGGHSLKVTSLVYQIHKAFNVEMSLSEVFINSTVKELELYIRDAEKGKYLSIEPAQERAYYPLSSAQNRMYILNTLDHESTYYNMPGAIMIHGNVDGAKIEVSFKKLLMRHEALRTSFEVVDDIPVQKINKDLDFNIKFIILKEENIKEFTKEFIRPFELSIAPLWRVTLAKLEDEKHLLLIDMHHIISDGTSINLLVKELFEIYNGQELPDLRIQYKDFSIWQNKIYETEIIKQQEKYWFDTFKNEVPVLNIPTDYTRPNVMSYAGSWHNFEIDEGLTKKLRDLAKQSGTTMFVIFLAAYNVLLARLAGQEDIVVGIPVAGRRHSDLENVMGMFINTVALRSYPQMGKTFSHLLEEVKVSSLVAFENQDYQFEMILDKLKVKRDQGRNPLFDTLFNYLNLEGAMSQEKIFEGELMVAPYELEDNTAKFDMTFYLREVEETIKIRCNYRSNLFKESTIKFITEQYIKLLEEIQLNSNKRLKDYDVFSRNNIEPAKNNVSTSRRVRSKSIK